MKRIIMMLCLIALITGTNAQISVDIDNVIGSNTEVIFEADASKSTLWNNAIMWANAISTEINKSVELEDKESGTIILKLSTYMPREEGINQYSKIKALMNLKIDCKDNRYRMIFSNFTSTIEVDRTHDIKYMSTSSLQQMSDELQLVADLSTYQFNKEVIWSLNKIVEAKSVYLERNLKNQKLIDGIDLNSRKGKRELESTERRIEENKRVIGYLDYILVGFGAEIDKIKADLDTAMHVSDDF